MKVEYEEEGKKLRLEGEAEEVAKVLREIYRPPIRLTMEDICKKPETPRYEPTKTTNKRRTKRTKKPKFRRTNWNALLGKNMDVYLKEMASKDKELHEVFADVYATAKDQAFPLPRDYRQRIKRIWQNTPKPSKKPLVNPDQKTYGEWEIVLGSSLKEYLKRGIEKGMTDELIVESIRSRLRIARYNIFKTDKKIEDEVRPALERAKVRLLPGVEALE